jgi:hypothetical protein
LSCPFDGARERCVPENSRLCLEPSEYVRDDSIAAGTGKRKDVTSRNIHVARKCGVEARVYIGG